MKNKSTKLSFACADLELDGGVIRKVKLRDEQHVSLPFLIDKTPVSCMDKSMNKVIGIKTLGELRRLAD